MDSNYILGFSGYKETNVLALPHNSVPDELEGVTNGTLANIIRQLSSLSRHAEEMFGNLSIEAEGVAVRSSNLQAKIDKLAVRVTQLDSTVEEGKVFARYCFGDEDKCSNQLLNTRRFPEILDKKVSNLLF